MRNCCIYRLLTASALFLIVLTGCGGRLVVPDTHISECPALFPDYTNATFPSNIAPPNFRIKEAGDAYYTEIGVGEKSLFTCQCKGSDVVIPPKKWKEIQTLAAGKDFYMRIAVNRDGKWIQYKDITNSIADSPIDPYLVYRLLYPGYELWSEMGIYQRDLTTYKQSAIIENKSVADGCMNCHSFNQNNPDRMMLHVRGKMGGTMVVKDGQVQNINTKASGMKNAATYPAWHPGGRYIAYSVNEVNQYFHTTGTKVVEVSDKESDLVILDTEKNQLLTDSLIYGDKWMETFPHWSPDGTTLYFCRAEAIRQDTPLDSIFYDLYRITFDPERQQFSDLQCVIRVSDKHQSLSFPRVSPNGKYLMFTLSDYGNFSIWHPESDLYLLDLKTGAMRNMEEVNSNDVDSYHSWSSTGEWFVFSSKRIDGLWARPYIAHFDPVTGKASKPFLLPQKSPDFYDGFTRTFNIPELITSPVTAGNAIVGKAGKDQQGVLLK